MFETAEEFARCRREFSAYLDSWREYFSYIISGSPAGAADIISSHGKRKHAMTGYFSQYFLRAGGLPDAMETGLLSSELYTLACIVDNFIDNPSNPQGDKNAMIDFYLAGLKGDGGRLPATPVESAVAHLSGDVRQRISGYGRLDLFYQKLDEFVSEWMREHSPRDIDSAMDCSERTGRTFSNSLTILADARDGTDYSDSRLAAASIAAVGNILDDIWDLWEDVKEGKPTFATLSSGTSNSPLLRYLTYAMNIPVNARAAKRCAEIYMHGRNALPHGERTGYDAIALFAQSDLLYRRIMNGLISRDL
jgi:hypothetical protein